MTDKIQQARRSAFESAVARDWDEHLAHFDRDGDGYVFGDIQAAWWAFNAALDCVVIELPSERTKRPGFMHETLEDSSHNNCRDLCIEAIESTNLGIKVK